MLGFDFQEDRGRLSRRLARLSARPRTVAALLLAFFLAQIAVIGFRQPWRNRDTWHMGFEAGRTARNLYLGYGYGSPFTHFPGDPVLGTPMTAPHQRRLDRDAIRSAGLPERLADQRTPVVTRPPIPPSAYVPPTIVYTWLGIFTLFGLYSPAALVAFLLFQCALMTATVGLFWRTLVLTRGHAAGGLGLLLLVLYPLSYYATRDTHVETIFLFLTAVTVWGAANFLREPNARWLWFHAVGSALAILSVPKALPFFTALNLWTYWRVRGDDGSSAPPRVGVWRRWLGGRAGAYAAAVGAAAVICWSPWIARNTLEFKTFVPLGTGLSMQFYQGNNPVAARDQYAAMFLVFPAFDETERLLILELGEPSYGELCWRRFGDFLAERPATYLRLCAERVFYLWIWPAHIPIHWTKGVQMGGYLSYLVVTAVLLIRLRPARWSWLDRTILLFFATYPLIHYASQLTMHRYRMPIELLLVVLLASAAGTILPEFDHPAKGPDRAGLPA
jgi:hypothetical protein